MQKFTNSNAKKIVTINKRASKIKFNLFIEKKTGKIPNVIKLRNDEPSGYYCQDGIFYLKARRKL